MKGLESQIIGKYELVRPIGEGSMGTVYLARDSFSLREVALKISSARGSDEPRLARRRRKLFFTEAKMAGMLRHPNILSTIDAGVEGDFRYLVMEYIAGAQTLDRFCDVDSLLPVDHAVGILLSCALAIGYAHEHGVIHRDIKPRNILLTQDNEVKIGDFGVALIEREDVEQTQVHGRLGSPRYMSPEQVRDEPVTEQSDIFSLGVVSYELLTGLHPFEGRSIPLIARRISRAPHVPARKVREAILEELSRIIDRTLKKHPAGRYSSAMDMAGDLSLVHDEVRYATRAHPDSPLLRRLRQMSLLEEFADSELEALVEAGTMREYRAEEGIMFEGESDHSFFLILSGEVVIRRAGVAIGTLKPGSCFGEAGLFAPGRRTATILAGTQTSVLEVPCALVDRVSVGSQLRFHRAFARALAGRLRASMEYIARMPR